MTLVNFEDSYYSVLANKILEAFRKTYSFSDTTEGVVGLFSKFRALDVKFVKEIQDLS